MVRETVQQKQSPSGSTGVLYRTLLCGPVPLSNFSPLLNLAPWRLLIQLRVYAIIKSSWGPLCSSLAAQTERSFCFPMISNKKPGSPSLISGLGRTYAPFGHACTYTLQNFRVFVPPNSPRIEGKPKFLPKAPERGGPSRQGGSENEKNTCLDAHAALHIRFGRM